MKINGLVIENDILKKYAPETEEDKKCPIIIIPEGVKKVGGIMSTEDQIRFSKYSDDDPMHYQAFRNNQEISFVYIPDTVEEIGAKSFEHCLNINRIRFPKNLNGVSEFANNVILTAYYNGTINEFKNNVNSKCCNNCRVVHCTDGDIIKQ